MTETEKSTVQPRRYGYRTRRILQWLALFTAALVLALGLAHLGVTHPAESAALRERMHDTRYGWLAWRLVLYAVLAWGFVKIRRAPGCKPAYRPALRRMALASAAFALLCEYAIFGGGLTL